LNAIRGDVSNEHSERFNEFVALGGKPATEKAAGFFHQNGAPM
jgi:hypothetical protein